MASPTATVASAGRSVGRAASGALGDVENVLGKAASRTREGAEDVWAEAKDTARKDTGRDAAMYTGLAATAALGVLELPVAAAVGVGYAILRRRR